MNNKLYDCYNLISTSQILPDHAMFTTLSALQQLGWGNEQISLVEQEKTFIIASALTHVEAYSLRETLLKCGLDTKLQRVPHNEQSPQFSLVPEGEEQTDYNALQHKLQNQQVKCKHCGKIQIYSANCNQCHKPLISQLVEKQNHNLLSRFKLIIGLIILLMSLALVLYLWAI